MEIILTKQLLGALIKNGYHYFLSKTRSADLQNCTIYTTLKPVKVHPLLHRLPGSYQRYYKISQELLQMATGTTGEHITVDLSGIRFERKLQIPYLSKKLFKAKFAKQ
ncbi:MAG: hypothetical protein EOP43_06920 [Sphingobacteriaceae bacterium]|nr:MAG: hypothetical protein EOP43_06920 [Sphingobacteriaceae bacterium]